MSACESSRPILRRLYRAVVALALICVAPSVWATATGTLTKRFDGNAAQTVALGGETLMTLVVSISYSSGSANLLSITDTLPAGMVVAPAADQPQVTSTCTAANATFTATRNPANKGNTPAFSPKYLARVGLVYREDRKLKLALSAVSAASQYFQDSNLPTGAPGAINYIPAKVPSYAIADFSADWWVLPQVRLLGGVSNLTDRKYYNRVFSNGIDPAQGRTFYVGAAYEF